MPNRQPEVDDVLAEVLVERHHGAVGTGGNAQLVRQLSSQPQAAAGFGTGWLGLAPELRISRTLSRGGEARGMVGSASVIRQRSPAPVRRRISRPPAPACMMALAAISWMARTKSSTWGPERPAAAQRAATRRRS